MKDGTKLILALVVIGIIALFYQGKLFDIIGYDSYTQYDKELQTGVLTYEHKDKCIEYQGIYDINTHTYACSKAESKTDKWIFLSNSTGVFGGRATLTTEQVINNKLRLNGQNKNSVTAITTQIQKGYDIKIKINYRLSSYNNVFCNTAQVLLNDKVISFASTGIGEGCIPSKTLDEDINIYYSVLEDKIEVQTTTRESILIDMSKYTDFKLYFKNAGEGYMDIDIKYKAPDSCKIDQYSVLVYDDFSTDFERKDLTYTPLSFCPIINPIRRNYVNGNLEEDERAEVLQKLNSNEPVYVEEGTAIRVFYITKYVEGMELACGVNEAINAKTNKCEIKIGQEEIQNPLWCNKHEDCWMPQNCVNIEATCINSKCAYSQETCQGVEVEKLIINEKIVYQEILKEIETQKYIPLYIQDNQFTKTFSEYASSMYFGDLKIATQEPSFVCGSYSDYNTDSCYRVDINGEQVNYGEQFNLNDHISGVCYAGKRVNAELEFKDSNWKSFCVFTLNEDIVQASFIGQNNIFGINTTSNYKVNVNSTLNFNNAGIFLDCVSPIGGVQRSVDTLQQQLRFTKTTETKEIQLDKSEYGRYDCHLTPYIRVFGDKWFTFKDSPKLSFSYYVGEEKGAGEEKAATQTGAEPSAGAKTTMPTNWTKYIFIGLIVILLLWWAFK